MDVNEIVRLFQECLGAGATHMDSREPPKGLSTGRLI
jgi:hypothetical protein